MPAINNAFDLALNQASFIGNKQNCIVRFEDKSNYLDNLHVTTYNADSQFAYGRSDNWYYAGGLSFQTLYTVHVNINNVAVHNNIGISFEKRCGNYSLSFLWCDWNFYNYNISKTKEAASVS